MEPEKQIQKINNSEKTLAQNLTVAILSNGNVNVELVNKLEVNTILKKYKMPNGSLNFPAIFSIPVAERIPAMAKRDFPGTIKVITVALTLAMETMNISRKMNAFQILDLAETIVDTAEEDDIISLEDLMLFLQKLTRGDYPELYEGIDQMKFMNRFGKYRDERYEEGRKIKENEHLQYVGMGDANRSTQPNELAEKFSDIQGRMSDMKEQLRDKTRENNVITQANKYFGKDKQ